MPWPDRIYQGLYRIAGTDQKERIPRSYSTQMQTMVNTLNDIRTSDKKITGTQGIGVLMANSLMFQRFRIITVTMIRNFPVSTDKLCLC